MTNPVIGNQSTTQPRLLDRLVVRNDIFCHNGPPLMPFAAAIAISKIGFTTAIVTRSATLAGATIVSLLIFAAWLVPSFLRIIFANPYVSARWLAAARAALGNEIINRSLDQLRTTRSTDHVIWQRELLEAIIEQRRTRARDAKAERGIRLRDVADQR